MCPVMCYYYQIIFMAYYFPSFLDVSHWKKPHPIYIVTSFYNILCFTVHLITKSSLLFFSFCCLSLICICCIKLIIHIGLILLIHTSSQSHCCEDKIRINLSIKIQQTQAICDDFVFRLLEIIWIYLFIYGFIIQRQSPPIQSSRSFSSYSSLP